MVCALERIKWKEIKWFMVGKREIKGERAHQTKQVEEKEEG
jgi:hypothetical protein